VGFVPGVLVDTLPAHDRPVYYQIGGGVSRPYAVVHRTKVALSPIAEGLIEVIRAAFA